MLPPFVKAAPLLERIEEAGFEAYFVGGSVRDSLLGRKISDVDIATSALPVELKEIFPHTVDVGIAHGTILVIFNGTPYEITTFRAEAEYSDFRRPDQVKFIRSLREDLKRRDFTMNAMAMDREGSLIDPYNGQVAIQNKQIKTVGDPNQRFGEDALRMMRAVRFVSQLGFSVEEKTKMALTDMAPLLEKIAVERKLVEFEKLLIGNFRTAGLSLLIETGLYHYLPALADRNDGLQQMLDVSLGDLSRLEMWTLLVDRLGLNERKTEGFLRQWKLPNKDLKQVLKNLYWLRFRTENDWTNLAAYRAGIDSMLSAEKLYRKILGEPFDEEKRLIKLYEALPIKELSELAVTGNDLLAWEQRKPGPWIKDVLKTIEEDIINGELNNVKVEIREWLIHCNQKLDENC